MRKTPASTEGPVEDHQLESRDESTTQRCPCQSINHFELIDKGIVQKLRNSVTCMKKKSKKQFLLGERLLSFQ